VHRGPVAASAALVHEVEGLVATGTRLKEAVGDVAGRTGARRNELYDAVLAARAADRERPVVDRTSAAGVDSRTAVTGGMPQGAEEIRWPGRRSDLAGSRHEEDDVRCGLGAGRTTDPDFCEIINRIAGVRAAPGVSWHAPDG